MAILFYKITGPRLSHDSLPVFGMRKRRERRGGRAGRGEKS